jgi:hypothetical protein
MVDAVKVEVCKGLLIGEVLVLRTRFLFLYLIREVLGGASGLYL